ncbi:MAG: hypothetical protein AMXMBFR20_35330 [Planctomycetia bacterium]
MYLSLLFWPLLCLPGYAIVRRVDREEADAGLLGVIAVSFLAVLAVLSPVTILCYVLHAPVVVLCAVIVAMIGWGIIDLSRGGAWREIGRLCAGVIRLEALIVIADAVIGLRMGAFLGGDAKVHLARIRFLLDHGLSNTDPYMAEPFFFPLYHTNIIHALYAACAKLFGTDAFGAWFVSLAWGKLLCASGAYYLAWRVFGSRWAAWTAALFCVAARGPTSWAIYPNQLAPFWLLPMMLGFAAQSLKSQRGNHIAIKMAAAALVMGQTHGLYSVFAVMTLGPLFAGRWMFAVMRKEPVGRRFVVIGLTLLVGLPFVAVTRWTTKMGAPPTDGAAAPPVPAGFVTREDGTLTRSPSAVLDAFGGVPGAMVFAAAGVLIVSGGRRREAWVVLVPMGICALLLVIPLVCSFLIQKAGEAWVVERLDAFFIVGYCALVIPAFVLRIEPLIKRRFLCSLLSLLALPAGLLYARHESPLTWSETIKAAAKPAEERLGYLYRMRQLRDFLAAHVPPGAIIIADPLEGMDLVQVYDCHVVVSISASNGVPDMQARFEDVQEMIAPQTPWPRRRELFLKRGVTFFFPMNCPIEWTVGHVAEYWLQRPWVISRLDLSESAASAAP